MDVFDSEMAFLNQTEAKPRKLNYSEFSIVQNLPIVPKIKQDIGNLTSSNVYYPEMAFCNKKEKGSNTSNTYSFER